jgi:phospholipase/carboxylesterase
VVFAFLKTHQLTFSTSWQIVRRWKERVTSLLRLLTCANLPWSRYFCGVFPGREKCPYSFHLLSCSHELIRSIALTRPDLVAGVVLMSGRVLPEVQTAMASPQSLEGLPILLVHGTADTVLPIHHARASRKLLSSLPVELTYHEYPMGHEVSQGSLNDVVRWLSTHLDKAEQR